jgi:ribosome maturation factor RimP
MQDLDAITGLIEPEARALGFDLVRVRWFGGDDPTLQIMAERPATGQLNVDDCAALSRAISTVFDALEEAGRDPIPEAYRLEVSSPGIDRPLTRIKDYAGWIGHDARVTLNDDAPAAGGRKTLAGPIVAVDGDAIIITDKKLGDTRFAFADVAQAKLLLTDRLIRASQPISTDGVEDFEDIDDTNSDSAT